MDVLLIFHLYFLLIFDMGFRSAQKTTQTNSVERKRSLMRVPSTSKIPRDFFRHQIQNKSFPVAKNSLEITFMPRNKEP